MNFFDKGIAVAKMTGRSKAVAREVVAKGASLKGAQKN